jgi:hypothetical protein
MSSFGNYLKQRSNGLNIVINGLLFNISWLAIVASHSTMIAPVVVAVHLFIHFKLMSWNSDELQLIFKVSLLGCLIDQTLFFGTVFVVAGMPALPPIWLTALWPVLATTLMHAFAGLKHRPVFAGFCGAAGAVLSYSAGTQLTDVAFGSEITGPVTIGLIWAFLFPLLLQLSPSTLRTKGESFD